MHFDLTHTDIDGEKCGFRPKQSLAQVKNSMPKLFPGAAARQNNIIVRPLSKTVHFVQLDDLNAAGLGRVGEAAFLTLETSPGNHQAWVAVSGLTTPEEAKDFARRLREGAGADHSASGATRVAGTANYKRKYEPYFPTVRNKMDSPRPHCDEGAAGGNGTGSRSRARDHHPGIQRQDTTRQDRPAILEARQGMAGLCPLAHRSAAQP
jgi:hypothetical protein